MLFYILKKVVKFQLWLAKKLVLWTIMGITLMTLGLIKSKTKRIITTKSSTEKSTNRGNSLQKVLMKKLLVTILIVGTLGLFMGFIALKKVMPRPTKVIR